MWSRSLSFLSALAPGRWTQKDNSIQNKNKRMQWVDPPYPSRGRRPRINLVGLVKKESKTGAYRYRHDGYGDAPGWCYTFHLDTVNRSVYITKLWSCPSDTYTMREGAGAAKNCFFSWKVFIHNWGGYREVRRFSFIIQIQTVSMMIKKRCCGYTPRC